MVVCLIWFFVVSYRQIGFSAFTVYNNSFNPSSIEGQQVSFVVQSLECRTTYEFAVASHNAFGGGIGNTSSNAVIQGETTGDF